MIRGETNKVEYKQSFDGTNRDKAHLAKEAAAFANSGGGELVYGVSNTGTTVGVDEETVGRLDSAKIGDYIQKYIGAAQNLNFTTNALAAEGLTVVRIAVDKHERPPIVMEHPGTYHDGKKQETLFGSGAIFVRKDTKACPAQRQDIERWLDDAEDRGERKAFDLMHKVAERPRGTIIEFSLPDTPDNRLQEAANQFKADDGKLASASDLIAFAVATDDIDLSINNAQEFIVQSALRKRTTLWWWIAELRPSSEWMRDLLFRTLLANDRDVSDAGKPILEVAAVVCPDSFTLLRNDLSGSSRYAHFRDAAAAYPDVNTTLDALERRARRAASAHSRADCLALITEMADSSARGRKRTTSQKMTATCLARVLDLAT